MLKLGAATLVEVCTTTGQLQIAISILKGGLKNEKEL